EELWAAVGHAESLFTHAWPNAEPDAMARDEVQIVVQVDGRVRSRLTADVGARESEIQEMALSDGRVQPWLHGRRVAKVVVVPGRLVNIVTRGCPRPARGCWRFCHWPRWPRGAATRSTGTFRLT